MTTDDESLVVAAQHGDLAAWSTLCSRHLPRLAAYLGSRLRRPDVVERLITEVVAGAWKHLPELENPADFPTWLRKAGGNLALQWSRKNPSEPVAAPFPMSRCGGDTELAGRMTRLDAALGKLPDPQRMLLEQHFRGQVELEALAASMHLQREGIEVMLDEALLALDRVLDASGS
ncbi:MAG TPA: sigma-70 family RNA polymerase sigma factor [Planctomycetota bacterium]|jgi:RNA polymerase sigma-70 factor (ECF subfamily)|nr:sigma-70 family RNA polymerase sigma factor [Planctomycetota bacterium]